jgi:predicted acylesterase/phospholipase RssA
MDVIELYNAHIFNRTIIGNYRIINKYNETNVDILNSNTLLNMITMPISDLLECKTPNMILYTIKLKEITDILYDKISYYVFNPSCSFIMGHPCSDDIKNVMHTIREYYNNKISNDFNNTINPYNLDKIVFSGGGSKGMLYIGCLLGLYASGQIFYNKQFAGTSAGAVFAVLVACITPPKDIFNNIKTQTINNIKMQEINKKYQEAISFIIERFCKRTIDSFYTPISYTFYGMWTALDNVIKHNGIYDPISSGFQIWFALLCKRICEIMGNNLDKYIIIKTNKQITENIIDTDTFNDWELVNFFTFGDYHNETDKTIILTGTETKSLTTIYYSHTKHSKLNILTSVIASLSIPWLFKAPMIEDTYIFDGGIFDNYPITICDEKLKDKIINYNTRIFGFTFDDNIITDAYEVIRELWLIYIGFAKITNINFVFDTANYCKISELFFEIRYELYKLLYYAEIDIFFDDKYEYNIHMLEKIMSKLPNYALSQLGIEYIISKLTILKTRYNNIDHINIGSKTDITDIIEIAIYHGSTYKLIDAILIDINTLNNTLNNTLTSDEKYYKNILEYLMDILCYYEIKYAFNKNNDLQLASPNFMKLIKKLCNMIKTIDKMIEKTIEKKSITNTLSPTIQIAYNLINKILKNNDVVYTNNKSYTKPIDYFHNTDMFGILGKCMTIINNKINNDFFNEQRTIKLNPFETKILHFNMDDNLKFRLIYEGYSKTLKYFSNILHLMEITQLTMTNEYIASFEMRYKNMLDNI